jgi:hypothetical protein
LVGLAALLLDLVFSVGEAVQLDVNVLETSRLVRKGHLILVHVRQIAGCAAEVIFNLINHI